VGSRRRAMPGSGSLKQQIAEEAIAEAQGVVRGRRTEQPRIGRRVPGVCRCVAPSMSATDGKIRVCKSRRRGDGSTG
jgi:hypothetical protein